MRRGKLVRSSMVVLLAAACAFITLPLVAGQLPPQAVFVDPKSFAVLGQNATFREDEFNTTFNPGSTPAPFFQVFDEEFLDILGPSASVHEIFSNETWAFAHEGPIYVEETDEVFFASYVGADIGHTDINHNNVVSKLSLADAEAALASGNVSSVNVPITHLNLSSEIQMTNGGTGPYKGNLLIVTMGRGNLPPTLAFVQPSEPYNVTVLLDNYYGRQFNSLDDIKIHPTSGKFYFTDTSYGYLLENSFRALPLLPNQVYVYDPETSRVRAATDELIECNGIAISADGKTAFVGDTGAAQLSAGNNQTLPATVYRFDIDPETDVLTNKRIFAYIDAGGPDGLQVDASGNLFASCFDGVQVFSPKGTLLGKIFLDIISANLVFAGDGRLVILAATKVFLVHLATKGINLGGP